MGNLVETKDIIFTDLVSALLTVNNWGLEKVCSIIPQMQSDGLLNLEYVATADVYEYAQKLEKAGYRRGDFMIGALGKRIVNAASLLNSDAIIDALLAAERASDKDSIKELLRPVKGVGPHVVSIYCKLRGL